jgi:ABC-type branched-subunit amino acid transport system ATPase component
VELALSTRSLNKSFGSLVVAQDIALELPPGVRYALIGPNGAGKTTLLNLLTGMLRPDSGQVFLGAKIALRADAREEGLALQINTLFPQLSAIEAVALAVLEREDRAQLVAALPTSRRASSRRDPGFAQVSHRRPRASYGAAAARDRARARRAAARAAARRAGRGRAEG